MQAKDKLVVKETPNLKIGFSFGVQNENDQFDISSTVIFKMMRLTKKSQIKYILESCYSLIS